VSTGAVASGTFDFAGNGALVIGQTNGSNITFGAPVSGLVSATQILDFANISFGVGTVVSYVSDGGSGTLIVTDGTTSASVNLIGNYTSANFSSGNDGNGGVDVWDPPVVSNGGGVSSRPNSSPPASGGNNTASDELRFAKPPLVANGGTSSTVGSGQVPSGPSLGGVAFNHALFAHFAATLSDAKQFGAFTSAMQNHETLAALSSAFAEPLSHHK
jgi:hypothetical protein